MARFAGTQVLDAKDDELCGVPSFELSFGNAGKTLENNTKGKSYAERAVVRVAWDDAGLHAFIRVYDTTFTPATGAQSWNGDGVELMFSSSTAVTGLTSTDKNTLHVIVSPPVVQYSLDTSTTGSQYGAADQRVRRGERWHGLLRRAQPPVAGWSRPGCRLANHVRHATQPRGRHQFLVRSVRA